MTTTALAGVVMIALIFVTLAVGFPIGLSIGIGSAAADQFVRRIGHNKVNALFGHLSQNGNTVAAKQTVQVLPRSVFHW